MLEADLAEVSIQSVDNHLRDIDEALWDPGLGQGEGKKELLIRAWETVAESAKGGHTSQVLGLLRPDPAGPGRDRRPDQASCRLR